MDIAIKVSNIKEHNTTIKELITLGGYLDIKWQKEISENIVFWIKKDSCFIHFYSDKEIATHTHCCGINSTYDSLEDFLNRDK